MNHPDKRLNIETTANVLIIKGDTGRAGGNGLLQELSLTLRLAYATFLTR